MVWRRNATHVIAFLLAIMLVGSYADEIVEDTRKGASLNKIPGGYMVALIEDLHKADDSTSVFLREMQEVNPDFKVPEELLDDSVTGSVITLVDSSFVE